jgi:hypothetical protein
MMGLLRKKYAIAIFSMLFVGHLITTWICFTKSEVIRPTAATYIWRLISEILAFPMLYFQPQSSNWLLVLMLFNSVIWSALLTIIVLFLCSHLRRYTSIRSES